MAKITFTNKEDNRVLDLPEINKVTASNMNEIKTSVNALYDLLDLVYYPKSVVISASDFDGNAYINTELIGMSGGVDFNVFTNAGSGVMLKLDDGYTFNSGTGTITTDPDDYVIQYYKKLT